MRLIAEGKYVGAYLKKKRLFAYERRKSIYGTIAAKQFGESDIH